VGKVSFVPRRARSLISIIHRTTFGSDFDPDEVARFVQRLYRTFGYEDWDIPYFIGKKFVPPGG
jgi:hypothetical protein